MLALKYEPKEFPFKSRKKGFRVGDRIKTYNSCLGTIVRMAKDEGGEYFIVKLDIMPGEFAYETSDLEKI